MTCQHFWKIAPATGPTSVGRCKKCREEREFKNSTPAADGAYQWGKVNEGKRKRKDGIQDVR